jgi:hypothetical protein
MAAIKQASRSARWQKQHKRRAAAARGSGMTRQRRSGLAAWRQLSSAAINIMAQRNVSGISMACNNPQKIKRRKKPVNEASVKHQPIVKAA